MKLKYVVDEMGGCAVFTGYVNHDSIGQACGRHRLTIVGAGFIEIIDGIVNCYGESLSLNIKSRGKEDAKCVANTLGLDVEPD